MEEEKITSLDFYILLLSNDNKKLADRAEDCYLLAEKLARQRVKNKFVLSDVSGQVCLHELDKIKLEPVYGSTYCQYSVIEKKLAILYQNQEKILQAIKLLYKGT